jgi:hypothetical protein
MHACNTYLQVSVYHLWRQTVQMLQRTCNAVCDAHPLLPRERLGRRAAGGRLARQTVVQGATGTEVEHKAALRPVGGKRKKPANVDV